MSLFAHNKYMKYSIEQYSALESNHVTEIWYKNVYTLKDSIYRNHLHNNINTVHLILIS